jgi:hypothetical protein
VSLLVEGLEHCVSTVLEELYADLCPKIERSYPYGEDRGVAAIV